MPAVDPAVYNQWFINGTGMVVGVFVLQLMLPHTVATKVRMLVVVVVVVVVVVLVVPVLVLVVLVLVLLVLLVLLLLLPQSSC